MSVASAMGGTLGRLVVRLALERAQFAAELAQAVTETRAAGREIEGDTDAAATAVNLATRAMGSGWGLAAGATVVAAGVMVKALADAEREHMAYVRAVVMTGNAAGVTTGQMQDMARGIDAVAGTQRQAAAALAALAGTGKVAGERLGEFALLAVQMERATGQSVDKTVGHFAELGEAPVRASLKLNESLNYLTAATYAQIKEAEDLGNREEAAAIAQDAYSRAMEQRAAQLEQQLGWIEKGWRGLGSMAAWAWDKMLNVGRPSTLTEQISVQQSAIDQLEKQAARGGLASGEIRRKLDAARGYLATLKDQLATEERQAAAQAQTAQRNKDEITLRQELEKTLSREEQRRLAVARAHAVADAGNATAEERARLVAAAEEKYADKRVRAARAVVSEQERMAQAGLKLADSLAAQEAGLSGGFAEQVQQLAAAQASGALSAERLAQAQAALVAQQPAMKAQAKDAWELEVRRAKAADQVAAQLNAQSDANLDAQLLARDYGEQLDRNARRVQFELGLLGKTEQARAVAIRQYEIEEGLQRKILEIKKTGASVEVQEAEIASVTDAANRAKLQAAQEVYVRDWNVTAKSVGDALTNALMEGGRSAWEYIKGLFRTQVLRLVIQATVAPIAGGLAGMLGTGPAMAGGVGGLGSLGALGGSAIGMGFSGAWGAGGGILSTLNAGFSLLGSGSAAGIGAGLGVMAGALGPIALGAALLSRLDDSGTYHTGAAARSDGRKVSAIEGPSIGTARIWLSDETQQSVNALSLGGAGMLNRTAKAFGRKGGYAMSTAFADDTSRDGAWGALVIEQGGQVRQDWRAGRTSRWAPREFANGEAGGQQYDQALAKSLRAELLAMDIPGWAAQMLNDLGDSPGLEALGQAAEQINDLAVAFEALGITLYGFAQMSNTAKLALVEAAGGTGALLSSWAAFQRHFYTDAERRTNQERLLQAEFAKHNMVLPTTRAEYRALVESQLAMGEAGADTAAMLLANADAFAELTPAAEEAAAAAEEAAADIARERDGLQRQYLQLIGDQTALRALELAALDESNRALQQQIWAEEDRQAALAEATRAAEEATRAAEEAADAVKRWAANIARERDGLQRQYLQLIGDQTALRALELAALDESNRALQQQIWAEGDRQAALAEATRALEEYSRSLESARNWLAGVAGSIRAFVAGGTGASEPAGAVGPALAAYREQYRLALGGDRDALQGITGFAGKLVSAAEQRMGATDARSLVAQVGRELLTLPEVLRPEQFIADAVTSSGAQTVGAVNAVPGQLDTLIGRRLSAGFDQIDTTLDGQVSRAEFQAAFGSLGTESTLNAIFGKLDTNGDGQISKLEAIRQNTLSTSDAVTSIGGRLSEGFDQIDTTLDGQVSRAEFQAAFGSLGTESTLNAIFGKLDTNGDGQISKLEAIRQTVTSIGGRLSEGFDQIDTTLDGQVSRAEFQAAFGSLGTESTLNAIFGKLDTNGDGQISKLEAIRQTVTSIGGRLSEGFDQIDTTLDGQVSRAEFQAAFGSRGTESTLNAIFGKLDTNGDGQISKLEAIRQNTLSTSDAVTSIGGRLSEGFDQIDTTLDGQVSRAEFQAAFGSLGTEGTLNAIFGKLDTNGDGQISKLEAIRQNTLSTSDVVALQEKLVKAMSMSTSDVVAVQERLINTMVIMASALRYDLGYITVVLGAGLTVRSEFRGGPLRTFATGGAFGPGGVVYRPTMFPLGLMGEAGPEAVLPLTNVGGRLGVRSTAGGGGGDRSVAVLTEVLGELRRQGRALEAMTVASNQSARRLRELELRGVMVRPAPGEVLTVEALS